MAMTAHFAKTDDFDRQLPKMRAYNFIKEQIVGGAWEAGSRVNPARIAEHLGISRMPVRDALAQLDGEGLVTVRPNQGAIVTILPPNELLELYEIRAVLEGLAARKACECITAEHLDELRLLSERLLRSEVDVAQWLSYHDQFHDFVCEIGEQRHLLAEIRRIRTVVQPYLLIFLHQVSRLEMGGDEHKLLIDSLSSGNPGLADQVFSHHVMSAGRIAVQFLEEKGKVDWLPKKGRQIRP